MVIVTIDVENFGNQILKKISELEDRLDTKLTLYEKVLLSQTGTLEQVLSILINSEVELKILKQIETTLLIKRVACIINKKTKKILVRAVSNIFPANLPKRVIWQIKQRNHGIGAIITNSELETFRKILRIGHNSNTRSTFRIYQIIYRENISFEIKENFRLGE